MSGHVRAGRMQPPLSGSLQVVARVAALLDLFSVENSTIDIQTSADALGVSRSTAHRYLASLESHGLLQRTDPSNYELGTTMVRIGTLALSHLGVVDLAGPVMREINENTELTVVLSAWGRDCSVVTQVVQATTGIANVTVQVGRFLPVGTAQSNLFVYYMDTPATNSIRDDMDPSTFDVIRAHQYAVEDNADGIRAIAVPVFNGADEIVATLAVVGLARTMESAKLDSALRDLRDGTQKLHAMLSGSRAEAA